MKFRTFIFGLIALSFVVTLFAAPVEKIPTASTNQYGAVTLESLDAAGLIKLNGTTITDNLHLMGSLITQNAEIGSFDIMGEANLTETTVKNGSYVMGSLQAVRSNFLAPLTILSQKILFTSCKLEGITVKQDNSFKGKQIIELKQRTIVDGPIHFESGKGEVLIYPGSQVLGPITGGKAIKKS